MKTKTLFVKKTFGDQTHYLLLNQDPEANNWELPRTKEENIENYINEVLGIPQKEIENQTIGNRKLSITVSQTIKPVLNKEKYSGGLFLKKKEIKQLLDSEKALKEIEKHTN